MEQLCSALQNAGYLARRNKCFKCVKCVKCQSYPKQGSTKQGKDMCSDRRLSVEHVCGLVSPSAPALELLGEQLLASVPYSFARK